MGDVTLCPYSHNDKKCTHILVFRSRRRGEGWEHDIVVQQLTATCSQYNKRLERCTLPALFGSVCATHYVSSSASKRERNVDNIEMNAGANLQELACSESSRKRMAEMLATDDFFADIGYYFPKAALHETVRPGDAVAMVYREGRLCASRNPLAGEAVSFWSVCANDERHECFEKQWPKPYLTKNPQGLSRDESVCVVMVGVAAVRVEDLKKGPFVEINREKEIAEARIVTILCDNQNMWGGFSFDEALDKIREYTCSAKVSGLRPVMGSRETYSHRATRFCAKGRRRVRD